MKGENTLFLLLLGISMALTASQAANITVTVQPADLVVREGDPLSLSCTASVESSRANLSLHYSWKKDGDLFLNGSSEIALPSAAVSDGGVYVCIAEAGEMEGTSENITVTIITDGSDDAYIIAVIVCATTVCVILLLFLTTIGLYMCFCIKRDGETHSKLCSCESGGKGRHQKHLRVPAKLSPSVPRHFATRDRSKSKSLSHLLHANFSLESNLHRSSTNLLTCSQPTQVTEIEDPNTLDDLVLDEGMFEQGTLQRTLDRSESTEEGQHKGRPTNKVRGYDGSKRRASEGTITDSLGTSLKSILKESKSVNENLNDTSRSGGAMSDVSSEMTHSDDNSLHLGKSVRFNVSVEDWVEDSGVQTGASTPHYTPYSSLKRRASEPDAFGHRFSGSERRGSAPGDLVGQTDIDEVEIDHNERDGDCLGEIDEGLATGSEEWSRQGEFEFEKEKVDRRFEGIFTSRTHPETQHPTQTEHEEQSVSSGIIASRVAIFSGVQPAQKKPGAFTRGPSSLATSYHSATISVADVKRRLLDQGSERGTENFGKEEGKRSNISKLVQQRSEVFRVPRHNLRTASLDRAHFRRGRPLDISAIRPAVKQHTEGRVNTAKGTSVREKMIKVEQRNSSTETGTKTKEGTPVREKPIKPGQPNTTTKLKEIAVKQDEKEIAPPASPSMWSSSPAVIPVFSGHSSLSNWVPACLRETVISPYSPYDDEGLTNWEEEEGESESSDDDEEMLEPLQPTTGAPMGPLPIFGGMASWLSSPNKILGASPTKPIMTGAREMSPFNESIQQGGHRRGVNRLSVIPEETASACNSMISMHTE